MTAEWEARTVLDEVLVDPSPVATLHALLDDGLPPVVAGDPLPSLWHWVALPRWSPSSAVGTDGHPLRGGFLPPVALPRRMFAGGEVSFYAPLTVGETVRREVSVTSVEHKHGRSGELVVVTVLTRLFAGDTLALEDSQDLIYRDAGARVQARPPAGTAPARPLQRVGAWDWALHTDPTLLMRFSAATANGHRIHYDHPYATQVEGYPGLVVHGPLVTLLLVEVGRLEGLGPITRLTHRNLAPLFCGDDASLRRTSVEGQPTTLQLESGRGDQTSPRSTVTVWADQRGNDR